MRYRHHDSGETVKALLRADPRSVRRGIALMREAGLRSGFWSATTVLATTVLVVHIHQGSLWAIAWGAVLVGACIGQIAEFRICAWRSWTDGFMDAKREDE